MKNLMKMKLGVYAIVGLVVALSIGSSVYFYRQYRSTKALLDNPTSLAQDEIKQIIKKIGAFMVLPTNEEPTLATVLDTEKLKEQPFFAKAAKGDKVVIYTKAGKAILYRPSENKIIEAMPIAFNQPEASISSDAKIPAPTVKPTIAPTPTVQPTE